MKVVALVDHENHVCCRFRLRAFASRLEAMGHRFEFQRLPKRWWGRLRVWPRLRGECVLLQRRLLSVWETTLLRRLARVLLYDIDDAVFLRDSYSRGKFLFSKRGQRFARLINSLDVAIAGNRFLADSIGEVNPNCRVEIIPTCVDPERYPLGGASNNERVRLVWVGSSSTLQGLERNRALLECLGRTIPGLELKMICDRFLTLDSLPVVERPWEEHSEPAEIATGDIGISWIPDDDWSRGKCGLKVLQYMAAGLPVVANPVGVHPEIVQHGRTGFLAMTHEEWIDAIERLSRSPRLRKEMGEAGRRRVHQAYSLDVGANLWNKLLNGLEPRLSRTG